MEINNIIIEQFDIKDINEVSDIQHAYPHVIISDTAIAQDLACENNYYIVAKLNNEIVGFAAMTILFDHADIIGIVVKNSMLNKGIGSLLLCDLMDKCKKLSLEKIFLEVRESNNVAISLYEKSGFIKISERKNYYPDNKENALIYCLDI